MSVGPDDVRRIAALAHLRIPEPEVSAVAEELTRILDHVGALSDAAEDALGRPVGPAAATRRQEGELEADPLLRPPQALAPAWQDGFFVMPRLPALGDDPRPGDSEDGL